MGINTFPQNGGFDPTKYNKHNNAYTNASLTLSTWTEVLNFSGKGKLGDIHLVHNNSSSDIKKIGLKVTIDGKIICWYIASFATSTGQPETGLTYNFKISSDDVNDAWCNLVSPNGNPVLYSMRNLQQIALRVDGTENTSVNNLKANVITLDEQLYFKLSLKVEYYVYNAGGGNSILGNIVYYTT